MKTDLVSVSIFRLDFLSSIMSVFIFPICYDNLQLF